MSKFNWNDVDKFCGGLGLSPQEAHRLNRDPLIQAKREEYEMEFDVYEEPLRTILYSGDPSEVLSALLAVPNDVLVAFFGVAGPEVLRVKTRFSGGTKATGGYLE